MNTSRRAEHLHGRWCAAAHAVNRALHAAGVVPQPYISQAPGDQRGVNGCRWREWQAALSLIDYLERRIRQLERAIRTIVNSDLVSEEQRRALLSGVYGENVAAQVSDAECVAPAAAAQPANIVDVGTTVRR